MSQVKIYVCAHISIYIYTYVYEFVYLEALLLLFVQVVA